MDEGERETAVNMGCEENALTLLRLRRGLIARLALDNGPPTRLLVLRCRCLLLHVLQGRRLVLTHHCRLRTNGAATSRVEANAVEKQRRNKGNGEHRAAYIGRKALYRPGSEWLTCGPI